MSYRQDWAEAMRRFGKKVEEMGFTNVIKPKEGVDRYVSTVGPIGKDGPDTESGGESSIIGGPERPSDTRVR